MIEMTLTMAVAVLCERYGLNCEELTQMFETLGCITPEQKDNIIMTCTAFAVRDMMNNSQKGA